VSVHCIQSSWGSQGLQGQLWAHWQLASAEGWLQVVAFVYYIFWDHKSDPINAVLAGTDAGDTNDWLWPCLIMARLLYPSHPFEGYYQWGPRCIWHQGSHLDHHWWPTEAC